jgi:uncharacterized protein YodC (DUF2158 family)
MCGCNKSPENMENKTVNTMFRVGDIVKLKSGGPSMTVKVLKNTLYQDDKGELQEGFQGFIACTWFDNLGELKQDIFEQEMLALAAEANNLAKEATVLLNKRI